MVGGRIYLDFGFNKENYFMQQHGVFLEVSEWHEKHKFYLRNWAKGVIGAVVVLVVSTLCGGYYLFKAWRKRKLRKELK